MASVLEFIAVAVDCLSASVALQAGGRQHALIMPQLYVYWNGVELAMFHLAVGQSNKIFTQLAGWKASDRREPLELLD
jgi:hypothetical protein